MSSFNRSGSSPTTDWANLRTVSLSRELHPNNFTAMSTTMAALVAYVIGGESWTDPEIAELKVTPDRHVLARHKHEIGFDHFIGDYNDFRRNWQRLLVAAKLTFDEGMQAEFC
jgi:hypothetical protein